MSPVEGSVDGVHVDPFQVYAMDSEMPLLEASPTAIQNEVVVQDALRSTPLFAFDGRPIVWTPHVEPFHCRAMGAPEAPPAPPTAWQKSVLVQETPLRLGPFAPGTVGVVTCAQADPFHCSTRIVLTPDTVA